MIFEAFQPPEMRGKRKYKLPELYIWFSFCSQNYRRMIKRFILSFWFIARFGYIFLQISPLFLLVPMYDSHFGYKQNIPKKTLGLLTSLSFLFFRFPDEVHSFKGPRSVTSSGPQTRSRTSKRPRSATSSGPQTRSRTSRDLVRPLRP